MTRFLRFIVVFFMGASLWAPMASAQSVHQITMQQADIRAFIDDVSMVTGKTFLVDPRVQGEVTISSEETLTPAQVFDVFKDVMRVHGYAVVQTPRGEYRITLIQGAAQDAPFVAGNGVDGQFSTIVIKLKYGDAIEAAKLIKPAMHREGVVTANANSNVLVVTDFPENLRKARQIVASLDKDNSVTQLVRLTNMTANEAQDALEALGGKDAKFRVIAVPGSNSVLLDGDAASIERIKPVLLQMDKGGAQPRGAVSIVSLRYADGAALIQLIDKLMPSYAREGQADPMVAYDERSNALVISAMGETQRELEEIIRRLDVRRPQVLVEAIIVEISDNAARELGVQFALGDEDGNSVPFIGTNFSRQAPDLLTVAGAVAANRLGINNEDLETAAINSLTGASGGVLGIGGQSGSTLFAAVLNAVDTDEDSNILSTPFVTTLDNVAARFVVGQEIPITTAETIGSTTVNPFRTFERKEVGIKLDVLPQISEGDVIRLSITQEVSSIAGVLTDSTTSDFITNTREIETTVLANDGEVIVLGGLIQDDEQLNVQKIPILGDVPFLGRLFRSEGKSRNRTNLMVFLRPKIIRTADDAKPITDRLLEKMRQADMLQSGRDTSKIDTMLAGP